MMKTKFVCMLTLLILWNNASAQNYSLKKENLIAKNFTQYTEKKYSDVPNDNEEIKKSIDALEEYRTNEENKLSEFENYKLQLKSPSPLKEIRTVVERYNKRRSQISQKIKRSEYNDLAGEYDNALTKLYYIMDDVDKSKSTFSFLRQENYRFNSELSIIIEGIKKNRDKIETEFLGKPIRDLKEVFLNDVDDELYSESDLFKEAQTNFIDLSKINIESLSSNYQDLNKLAIDSINKGVSKIVNKLDIIEGLIKKYKERKKELSRDINEWGIQRGLPWYCGTVVILFLVTVFSRNGFRRNRSDCKDQTDGNNQEHLSKVLLEVITVLLLTLTILILGLSNILKENVLGTLIGGIAAYILNRATNMQKSENGNNAPPKQPQKPTANE